MITHALFLIGVSAVGGAILWAANDLREKYKQRKYRLWRSKWHLIKGGLDGHRE